jgi:hypothetical protein
VQDWLEWQRKVIREEYMEGKENETVRGGKDNQNTGRRKVEGR